MNKSDTEVDILINGKPIKVLAHNNQLYVQSNHGSEYSIKIKNNSYKRRLFCVTVDGINVVSGLEGQDKQGYVLSGYQSFEIKGWRTSNEEVHPFKFSAKDKSYAAKSAEISDTSNCGVIGIKVYEEKEKPQPQVIIKEVIKEVHVDRPYPVWPKPYYPPYKPWYDPIIWTISSHCNSGLGGNDIGQFQNTHPTFSSSVGSTSRCVSNNVQALNFVSQNVPDEGNTVCDWDSGTEFSKQSVQDKVYETEFELGRLVVTILFFYATRKALTNMGVPVEPQRYVSKLPEAFPTKFCKPPK